MRYFFRGKTLFVRGDFRAASTGVNGGLRKVTTLFNHTVDSTFDHDDPLRPMEEIAAGMGFSRDFFGLLTAVPIRTSCILHYDFITLFVTAGVTDPNPGSAGTINIIVHSAEGLSDGALLETILTATTAKADALRALGHPFSGTITDAVVAACEGPPCHTYAGTATEAGRRIYHAAFRGVQEALARHEGTGREKSSLDVHLLALRGRSLGGMDSRGMPLLPLPHRGAAVRLLLLSAVSLPGPRARPVG